MVDPLSRLVAIEDLRTLKARYWRFVDTKRWAELQGLLAPDATFTDHASEFHGEGAREIVGAISAGFADVVTVHHGHQSELTVIDEDHASGIWAMEDLLIYPPGGIHPPHAVPTPTLRGSGHYYETYVRTAAGWRFQTIELYRLRLETVLQTATPYPA